MDATMLRSAPQWAEQVFGNCDLNDKRRTRRLVQVARDLGQRPQASLGAACQTEADQLGAYRLIENDQVAAQAIAQSGFEQTAAEASKYDLLVAASDTTTVAYSHPSAVDELGDVGGPETSKSRGFLVHSQFLREPTRGKPVGLIDQLWWRRDPQQRGKNHSRRKRRGEQKESAKWQISSSRMSARLGPLMVRVIEVADREADVFAFLAYKQERHERYVIRSCQDRALVEADTSLSSHLASQAELGRIGVEVPQRGGRKARCATLALRAGRMTLRPPRRVADRQREPIEVSVVLAEEVDPPPGVTPLCWRLYTSEPIDTLEQVKAVVHYYTLRWGVEEFHKSWKTGCKVESRRLQTAENLRRLGQILAFVAVRLMQLRYLAHDQPQQPCEPVLDRDEWQCLWLSTEDKPLPKQVPTVAWAYYAIARLGGFRDTKRTGRVGLVAMFKGHQRLRDRLEGYRLAKLTPDL